MNLNVAGHQARAYTVATPVYEGPLDLLLKLIERAELDITKLALAQVTNQYLEYTRALQTQAKAQSAEEVSAFLVIAARLVQIKSEALLPRPPTRETGEEEDAGEALARQLIAYKRYKEIAASLGLRAEQGLRTYLRMAAPPKVEGKLDLQGIGLPELVQAAWDVFQLAEPKPTLDTVVAAPRVTIREKISQIVAAIRQRGRARFRTMLGKTQSRMEVVVAFLAMLELVKRRRVAATQAEMFAEIEIEPAEAWDDGIDFELEFGE